MKMTMFYLCLFLTLFLMISNYFKLLNLIILLEITSFIMFMFYLNMIKMNNFTSFENSIFLLWFFVCESCIMLTFYILFLRNKNLFFMLSFKL